jgi:hypothetical protein
MTRIFERPNYAVRWTTEDYDLVAAELRAGRTIPEIAKAMGRSQEAVRAKAWKAGLLPGRVRKPAAPSVRE